MMMQINYDKEAQITTKFEYLLDSVQRNWNDWRTRRPNSYHKYTDADDRNAETSRRVSFLLNSENCRRISLYYNSENSCRIPHLSINA